MSDRKYRQHGYQDEDRGNRAPRGEGAPRKPPEPRDPRIPRDPRVPNMPGFREVFRCARCGHLESPSIASLSKCGKCGVDLRACIHCASFDSGARFECRETIPARVSPKDAANNCALFAARMQVERETGSASSASGQSSAKKALDDLFKF
jgi:hypothetical protein